MNGSPIVNFCKSVNLLRNLLLICNDIISDIIEDVIHKLRTRVVILVEFGRNCWIKQAVAMEIHYCHILNVLLFLQRLSTGTFIRVCVLL